MNKGSHSKINYTFCDIIKREMGRGYPLSLDLTVSQFMSISKGLTSPHDFTRPFPYLYIDHLLINGNRRMSVKSDNFIRSNILIEMMHLLDMSIFHLFPINPIGDGPSDQRFNGRFAIADQTII